MAVPDRCRTGTFSPGRMSTMSFLPGWLLSASSVLPEAGLSHRSSALVQAGRFGSLPSWAGSPYSYMYKKGD